MEVRIVYKHYIFWQSINTAVEKLKEGRKIKVTDCCSEGMKGYHLTLVDQIVKY